MNIVLATALIIAVFLKSDWKNWEHYYPEMLYIALAASVYELIGYKAFNLWEFKETALLSKFNVHLLHNLVVNPIVVLLYLSNYPIQGKKLLYNLKWILGFWTVEWFASILHVISYHNGWNLVWSLLFIMVMFPMVRLHHTNKSLALPLSVVISIMLLLLFGYI